MRSIGGCALGVALALAIASCGGSSSAPTKAEFIRVADSTCKQGKQRAFALMRARHKEANASDAAMSSLVLDSLALNSKTIADLAALDVPAGLRADYDAYLATRRRETALARQVVKQAEPGSKGMLTPDSAAAAISARRDDLAHQAVAQAQAMGLHVCGA